MYINQNLLGIIHIKIKVYLSGFFFVNFVFPVFFPILDILYSIGFEAMEVFAFESSNAVNFY